MRIAALILLIAGFAAADTSKDDAKNEWQKLNGTWSIAAYEREGKDVPLESADFLKKARLHLADGKYTTKVGEQTIDKGTIKLDLSKKPKQMDIKPGEGPNQGKIFRVIYEVDGDSFKACYSKPDGERPTEFKTKPDTGQFMFTYKRQKAAAAEDAIQKEFEALNGTWLQISGETGGQKLSEEAIKGMTFIVKDTAWTFEVGGQVFKGTWKIDPTKKPKTYDSTSTDGPTKGQMFFGIYELEGDTLRMCHDIGGKERPKEFVSKPGTQIGVAVLKRVKK